MAARFDLSDYVDVAERIEEFYTNHPNGHITTQLLNTAQWTGKQTQFIVQAFLYDEKGVLLSTGLAEESLGGQGANQMAALENAETSAIGRATSNLGYQTSRSGKRQRATRQEMQKVQPIEPSQDQIVLKGMLGEKFKVAKDRKAFIESVVFHDVDGVSSLTPDEVKLCIDVLATQKGE